ncbi:MAG TPA: pyruvate carboxylase subunit B, partial [Candidatus Wallbacteria bacterium]|nr:pyruvate carboxylase subunit B [Candidatus Wallbacteria bacterium]
PAPINPEVIKLAIGDQVRITGRPADTIAPEWQKCKDAVKQYSDKDEDVLSYALFPQVAIEYFENLKNPMKKEKAADGSKTIKPTHPEKQFVLNINGEKYEVGIAEVVMDGGVAGTGC